MAIVLSILVFVVALVAYLWQCNRQISVTYPEAARRAYKRWTKEQIRETYRQAEKDPIDVRKFLPPKLGRRYVVTGGSGLSGGWIVQHLLIRGEDPKAIRIVDLVPNTRPPVVEPTARRLR